jgi:hypothetical protein
MSTRGQPQVAGRGRPLDEATARADDSLVSAWARVRQYTAIAVGAVGLLVDIGYALGAGRLPSFWTVVVVLPLYLLAVWLIRRRPEHPQARRLLLFAACMAAGVALESVVGGSKWHSGANEWFWAVNLAHMYTSILATVAAGVLVASYPDGVCGAAMATLGRAADVVALGLAPAPAGVPAEPLHLAVPARAATQRVGDQSVHGVVVGRGHSSAGAAVG